MTDTDRIQQLEAELAQLRQVVADQAAALAAHAAREEAERTRKESRSRVNRENYARRLAKMVSGAVQTSDSDQIQSLNPPPLDGSPLPPGPTLPSPLSSPPTTSSSADSEHASGLRQTALLVPLPTDNHPKPEALQALWNRLAPPRGLPRWEGMGDKRKAQAKAALAVCPDLARWEAWLVYELARPFYAGSNDSGWRANPDWLLRVERRDQVRDFDPTTATALRTPSGGDKPRLGPAPTPTPVAAGDKPRL